jgi:hypothetical protein
MNLENEFNLHGIGTVKRALKEGISGLFSRADGYVFFMHAE